MNPVNKCSVWWWSISFHLQCYLFTTDMCYKCSVWWWSISFHLQCYLFTTDIKGTNRTRSPCFGCRDCVRFNIFGATEGVRNADMSIIVEKCITFAAGKWIQDISGSWIPCHGFRILDTGFRIICQWNLDSRYHSLMGFRILWAVFWIPKSRIPDFTSKNFPDPLTRISLHGANYTLFIQI